MKSSYSLIETPIKEEVVYKIAIGKDIVSNALTNEGFNDGVAIVGEGIAKTNPWLLDELDKVSRRVIVMEDGENAKNLETALKIIETLWKERADRWTPLIVAAGGSLGDTAAFAASIYMRGIPLAQIPTTLLAMVDSSIGGKTAVNWKGYKNIIGSFYHPSLIVDDLRFLETLPRRVYKSSLAEVIKYGVTLSKEFFDWLKENASEVLSRDEKAVTRAIENSVKLKLSVVGMDPRERKGIREVLNYGHTVGHAIESLSMYKIYHGEAVALGMLVESRYAHLKGLLSEKAVSEIDAIIRKYEILDEALSDITLPSKDEYKRAVMRDKKRMGDKIRLPVLRDIGKWELMLLPVEEFAEESYKILVNLLENLRAPQS